MTVALGDSPNDLPMLRSVDRPIIVEKHGGGYDRSLRRRISNGPGERDRRAGTGQ
jgi:phosphoserine phosphatase